MSDLERATQLAAIFANVGDKWRGYVPLDLRPHRTADVVDVGSVTIVRCADGVWRRAADAP